MQQTAIVIGLGLACALAGAALAVALNTQAPEPVDDARDDDAIVRALEQLSVQLAVLDERLEIRPPGPSLAPARSSQDPVADGIAKVPAGARRNAPREAHAITDAGPEVARTSPESGRLPAAQRDTLRDLGEWQDGDQRAAWLFVSQHGVLTALGMPDEVSGSSGSEYRTYRRADQPSLTIVFNAGRVIRMSP